jgi:LCP family protein required for cell wall assembly
VAAALSAIIPGLGQAANGRLDLALRFAVPVLILALLAWLFSLVQSGAHLLATVVNPTVLTLLLILNVVVLGWRAAAVLQAFFDRRYPPRPGRLGVGVLVVALVATAWPHWLAWSWGSSAHDAFARIFSGGIEYGDAEVFGKAPPPPQTPGGDERTNILLIGIDAAPGRTAVLTDSLMVVSIDRTGRSVVMVSVPRDLVGVPLGDGDVFGPKLNSLLAYGDRHPDRFPDGGIRALENAIGAMLGIKIHYYAEIDFANFVQLVDAFGGVDVNVVEGFNDTLYDGYGFGGKRGWSITPGPHHFDGVNALAFARSRLAPGQSDFKRAARQQQILIALRDKLLAEPGLLMKVPEIMGAVGNLVRTDLPADTIPGFVAIAEELPKGSLVSTVLQPPIVKSGGTDPVYGSVQEPQLDAIAEVAKGLFAAPGTDPIPWPTPKVKPTPTPSGS